MKASILYEFNQPLLWQETDRPTPGPTEVLIQVMACGIDGTDLKLLSGFGYTPDLPFIMGHEIAGVIAEVGDHVIDFKLGEWVIAYNFTTCGECLPCLTAHEQLCVNMGSILGVKGKNGGYAEYVVVPERQLVRISPGVTWTDAAICCDAGLTAFHAVDRSRLKVGETVLIIGIGGVGSVAVQVAKAAGACVFAVEVSAEKEAWAREMGADETLNPSRVDIPATVRELTNGFGVDCVIDIVGQSATIGDGINALRHGGRLLLVGYTPDYYALEGKYLAQNELELLGTRAGRKQDLINAVSFMASDKAKSIVTQTFPMKEANEALATLRYGEVCGRIVLLT